MDTSLEGGEDGYTCLDGVDGDTCLGACVIICLGACVITCLGACVITCLGAGESSLTLARSLLSRCSLTMVSMGTPTPMSRLSGSKSGGGRTGSRYGASKSSMGRQGLSKSSLSGVEPPLSTSSESSASQTCGQRNGISVKMMGIVWTVSVLLRQLEAIGSRTLRRSGIIIATWMMAMQY